MKHFATFSAFALMLSLGACSGMKDHHKQEQQKQQEVQEQQELEEMEMEEEMQKQADKASMNQGMSDQSATPHTDSTDPGMKKKKSM